RKIFPACCACATAPHRTNARAKVRSPAHFGYFDIAQYRFWIADGSTLLTTGFGLSEKEFRTPFKDFSFMPFPFIQKFKIKNPKFSCHPPSPYNRAQLSQRIFLRLSFETPSSSKNSSTARGKSESPCG